MQSTIQRFEKFVMPEPNTGCWIWSGAQRKKTGYGGFKYNGKMVLAHRMAFLIYRGEPDESLSVCHSCDNTFCVNPDHLFQGTHQENMTDMKNKGRANWRFGASRYNAKFNEDDVRNILQLNRIGVQQSVLTEMYKVHKTTIQNICSRKSWKHIQV